MDKQKQAINRFLGKLTVSAIPAILLFLCMVYYISEVRTTLAGDLGQLGKISFDEEYFADIRKDRLHTDLFRNIEPEGKISRIATIGDSFSQMGGIGFQAYLADDLNDTITNIPYPQSIHNAFQGAWGMLRSGMFDGDNKPEIIILEVAERFLIDCAVAFDPAAAPLDPPVLYYDDPNRQQSAQRADWRNYLSRMSKQTADWLKLRTGIEKNPVRHVKLSVPAFTVPGKENDLYFMLENKYWTVLKPEELVKVRQTVELLHDEFAKRDIKMFFLIAADKYGLHQDQIVDNPYPRRETGVQYSAMDTLGYVLNTFPVLKPYVDRGVKDMNMADDSHWSYKSSEIVADTLSRLIK